jgi:hypothetical protein
MFDSVSYPLLGFPLSAKGEERGHSLLIPGSLCTLQAQYVVLPAATLYFEAQQASIHVGTIMATRAMASPFQKETWAGRVAQVVDACLAGERPRVQTPVPSKKHFFLEKKRYGGHWWLMPILLASYLGG